MKTKLVILNLLLCAISVNAQYEEAQDLGPNVNVVDSAPWKGNLYVQNRIRLGGTQIEIATNNENNTPNRALGYFKPDEDILYVNASGSNGASDFTGGTYLNSRVAIGNRPYWETPSFYTNNIMLAVNGRTWTNGKAFFNDKIVLGRNTGDSHKLSFISYKDGDNFQSDIDYRGSLIFKGLNGYASVSSWQTMVLTQKGNVLVNMREGDIRPELAHYKLQVNGNAVVEGLKVLGDVPQSDYVFENDYKLRSLEEVEAFITAKKHLPEVPSAADFKKDGYLVGKMDDVLLRKVEELTLYMIKANKQIQALQKELTTLKSSK
ncbi:hypothetical protein [Tenacibaculum amylolyticum]|uniref:hypothetical protein n=1 Tax=Tenacibaculum amylolyticum TaxID=104269 RepID=UPI003895BB94